jgi:hypothetical protein
VELTMQGNGTDFVRGVCALHTKPIFAFAMVAANVGVRVNALEDFIRKGKPLPPEAMSRLVDTLFQGKARWDEPTQTLADVVKPAAAMMEARDKAPTAINAPASDAGRAAQRLRGAQAGRRRLCQARRSAIAIRNVEGVAAQFVDSLRPAGRHERSLRRAAENQGWLHAATRLKDANLLLEVNPIAGATAFLHDVGSKLRKGERVNVVGPLADGGGGSGGGDHECAP